MKWVPYNIIQFNPIQNGVLILMYIMKKILYYHPIIHYQISKYVWLCYLLFQKLYIWENLIRWQYNIVNASKLNHLKYANNAT